METCFVSERENVLGFFLSLFSPLLLSPGVRKVKALLFLVYHSGYLRYVFFTYFFGSRTLESFVDLLSPARFIFVDESDIETRRREKSSGIWIMISIRKEWLTSRYAHCWREALILQRRMRDLLDDCVCAVCVGACVCVCVCGFIAWEMEVGWKIRNGRWRLRAR